MKLYTYDGPVLVFGRCVTDHWIGSTYASSEKKARSNLAYQFKKEMGYGPTYKATITGKIIEH